MNLRKLTLRNFGPFEGTQELSFQGEQRKKGQNIVLVGGKNGAGKTSILDGLRLCLYGYGALGLRAPEAAYFTFLRKKINHAAVKDTTAFTAVTLAFDFPLDGKLCLFEVTRSWRPIGGAPGINESLEVRKDGRDLDQLERNQWQSFINELIPRGVANFFFFDAEQIETLIDDDSADERLKESIHALLNLDLLRRLEEDLQTIESKLIRRTKDVAPRLHSLLEREEGLIGRREEILRTMTARRAESSRVETEVRRLEQTIFVEGKSLAEVYGKLKQRKAQIEKEQKTHRNQWADIAGRLVPIVIARGVAASFLKTLESEERLQRQGRTRDIVLDLLPKVLTHLSGGSKPNTQDLKRHRESWHKVFAGDTSEPGRSCVHNLPESDASRLRRLVESALQDATPKLKEIEAEQQALQNENKTINDRIRRIEHASVGPDVEREYAELKSKLVQEMAALHSAKEDLSNLTRDLDRLQKEKENLAAEQTVVSQDDYKIRMGGRVSRVIDRYFKILFAKKLEELATTTTEVYATLARKKGHIKRITFSHDTLRVSLEDSKGTIVSKDSLSAGEKQMLAVSILWALGRVSGKKLPIVIDTPLARLDSDHRESFVITYLPHASHQVVVLSTDTEIDRRFADRLKGKVAREYLLEYDVRKGKSTIQPGYFFGRLN